MEQTREVINEGEHAVQTVQAEAVETHAEVGTASRFEGVEGAINVSIVAFSIVFGVLIVLTAMIYAVRVFAADEDEGDVKKNDSKPQPVVKAQAPAQAVAAAPVVAQAAQAVQAVAAVPAPAVNTPQTKIVAAITAAIMAATLGAGRIVSIQPALALPEAPAKNTPNFGAGAWKTSGRIALVHNRLSRTWR